ncbi:Two-component system response regulator [hydrothermal vent metagenome]|uniref:Two-component system response regulator n=1 Tax=hydrothermal vent metagenome TaxID=652676 RepID=A0A1W1CZG5_9ZZZZ
MQTIIVVEDEQDLLDLIEYTLSSEGYDVICCLNTSNVEELLNEEEVNLILMDRNLPNIEGSIYIQSLRDKGYDTPVIYLTAKDKDEDIIEGFERGGDDYITKPFNLNVLKARVKALIKRTSKEIEQLKIRDICYKASNKKFHIENKEVKLTQLEHDLLLELISNRNILLSRDTLLLNVWKDYNEVKPKTVNVAINRLKEKIDPRGEKEYIKSVRGEGYIFA